MSLRGPYDAALPGPALAFVSPWSKPPFLVCKGGSTPCPLPCSSKVRKPHQTQSVPEPLLQAPHKQPVLQPCHLKQLLHLASLALPQQPCSQISCEPDHQDCAGLTPGSRVSACGLSSDLPSPPHSHSLVTASWRPTWVQKHLLPHNLCPFPRCGH